MKIYRLINHLKNGRFCDAGSNVGNELARNRLYLLKQARSELSKIDLKSDYARGYKDAILDIMYSYENAVEDNIRKMIQND